MKLQINLSTLSALVSHSWQHLKNLSKVHNFSICYNGLFHWFTLLISCIGLLVVKLFCVFLLQYYSEVESLWLRKTQN